MNPRQLFRMSKWARKPPSASRVKLLLAVIAIALAIWGLEKLFGTPEWMNLQNTGGRHLPR
ncbi:MAG: hypothetical protein AUK37_00600 [Rhodobacterales bacterium CG2_30_65_12]|nr:MAG: hypothetical protein AUK37_00600 [Rhodobacterales bacterium CG2_30_65_12]